MHLSRRQFLEIMLASGAAGLALGSRIVRASGRDWRKLPEDFYEVPPFGNVHLLHYTDTHAQLEPVYFREPSVNIGVRELRGDPPLLAGEALLEHYGIRRRTPRAHAFTHLDFVEGARTYGPMGGYAHLKTAIELMREERPDAMLMDGGDTWQGSGPALWTDGQDMVDAQKRMGIDVTTGHWEFTYGDERVREIVEELKGEDIEFLAQNVLDRDWLDPVFKAYTIRELNGTPVAIIGEAFPYTPIANPGYKIPQWTFGIREDKLQQEINSARDEGAQIVVLLSHSGMLTDIEIAKRVDGLDVIMGGHTHDPIPQPEEVENAGGGRTIVSNGGSNGKFLCVLDLDVGNGGIRDYQYTALPIFADHLEPDPDVADYVSKAREPFRERLDETLATTDDLLYRRGNFNGTFDEIIVRALMEGRDAEVALSPGFRWGVSVLPGEPITFDEVMTHTATTYSETTRNEMTGEELKFVLEDVANSIFNPDPWFHRGGDMVRTGGLRYTITPDNEMGERISDLEINGEPVDPDRTYVVASWASVDEPQDGAPVWELVSDYLRDRETVSVDEPFIPKLKGVQNDPGLAG